MEWKRQVGYKEVAVFRNDRFAALKGFAVLLAAALLFALLATACDGDDGGGDTTPAGETPAIDVTAEGANNGPVDGDTEDGDATDGDGADGEGLQELEALASEAAEGATGKVTYNVVTETDGETTMEAEWVFAQRPPDTRIELADETGGEESRVIVISAGGNYYYCISAAGEEYCMTSDAEGAETATSAFDSFFSMPQDLAEDSEGVDIDTSQRSIAGVDATCFSVSSTLSDIGENEVCFSEGGLLLYLNGESVGQSFTLEATSVSTDVSDADFEPPYDILDLSGLEDLEDLVPEE